ncbi:MAG: DUF4129 domain-containing protein, partial [Candidatus Dormibacteraeota bacterium]|nr:DUF4129 domain-containing protein [Candidatus Dormibacteraeota bacterium]
MRPGRAARPNSAGLAATGAIVIVLACLVGLASRPAGQPGSSGGGHAEVLVLVGQVLLFLVLAAAIVLGVLIASALWQGRRGGRAPETPEEVDETPPAPWADRLIALALALVLLAGAAGVVWLALHFGPAPTRAGSATAIAFPTRRPLPGAPPTATSPFLTWLAAAAALTIMLAVVLAALWWLRRRRPVLADSPRHGSRVAAAVEEGLDALRSDPDPRRAVIRAYGAMEHSLAAAGAGRRQFEAPYEYLQRVLAQFAAPPDQVSVLTRLFGLAKFSQHRIDEEARRRAIDA